MAKKSAIPEVPPTNSVDYLWKRSVKDTLDQITGARGGQLQPLPLTSTNEQIIAKINEIIVRINFG